ncbi:MAG: drug/metabolite transporter (DMT)-like permease [Ascidiaceihabitans sp.]|jgi:drug/metabolite transporter (DMT)-like permease
MLLFSALVAGSFSLGSMAANEIAPGALNAVRFGIAAVVIWVFVMASGGVPKGSWTAPWRYAILGAIFGMYFVLMFEGLKTAPPVSAAAVFTLTPVLTAVFGYILLRQILTPRMGVALLIGGLGALWVIFRADFNAAMAFEIRRGEAIYFVGCICHAIYTPLVRKLNRGESARVFSLGVLVAGCVIITAFSWSDIRATDWLGLPRIVWITILYVSVFASASTFVLTQFATMRLPSAKVMAYTYLVPSWVILWELALGNGAPVALVLIGVGMTITALTMLLRD